MKIYGDVLAAVNFTVTLLILQLDVYKRQAFEFLKAKSSDEGAQYNADDLGADVLDHACGCLLYTSSFSALRRTFSSFKYSFSLLRSLYASRNERYSSLCFTFPQPASVRRIKHKNRQKAFFIVISPFNPNRIAI